jgi:hypothetical protein
MSQCTAPIRGHKTRSAAENCPACRGGGRRYGGYTSYSPPWYPSSGNSGASRSSSSGGSHGSTRPRWAPAGSSVLYTAAQVQFLTPYRESVEKLGSKPDLRDAFLCHAWPDRKEAATELHDLLESRDVKVWFSEKDIGYGVPFLRAIDKGLANSRIGLVLVTPAMLLQLPKETIADKELSALLAGDRLIPVVHKTTYEALREVSPLLASRNGFNTAEEPMVDIATKIAELVKNLREVPKT